MFSRGEGKPKQELPCSILASLFYIPCSLPWVVPGAYANKALFLRPIREGDANTVYTQDLSGKEACWARCPPGSLHSGQCFLFYFFFLSFFLFIFFFTVHGVCGCLAVTSSTHHFISISPHSNWLTLAKKLFLRTYDVMPSTVINAGSSGIVWFGHIGVVIEQLPFPPGSTGII